MLQLIQAFEGRNKLEVQRRRHRYVVPFGVRQSVRSASVKADYSASGRRRFGGKTAYGRSRQGRHGNSGRYRRQNIFQKTIIAKGTEGFLFYVKNAVFPVKYKKYK